MDPAFAAALKRLEVGGHPEIVRTGRGIHLVQVTDRATGDAQLHWRRMEAQWILRERKREHQQKSRIERFIP
jgi:parvulin-like peptidyl-prolyl isomerase